MKASCAAQVLLFAMMFGFALHKCGGRSTLVFDFIEKFSLGSIARFHGFSIWKFIKYIKAELLIVLGASSSESVLPRMMAKLENLGAKQSVVGLVVPTG